MIMDVILCTMEKAIMISGIVPSLVKISRLMEKYAFAT
jgi:hypothetical protein